MKTMNKTLCFIIFLLVTILVNTSISLAQEDYQEWLKKQQEAFQEFKDARDKAFTDFLKKEWKEMQAFQGLKRDEKPKPIKIPIAEKLPPLDKLPLKDVTPPKIIKDIPLPEYVPVEEPDLKKKPEPIDIKVGESLQFDYFTAPLTVNYDKALIVPASREISKESISVFWTAISQANYETMLSQAKYYKEQMQLNDWGYSMLLHKIAEDLYPTSQNQRNLFIWFMLSKSGYEAKIGYTDNQIFLLLPSENVLYGLMYFTIDGVRFYLVTFDGHPLKVKTLYTYDGKYPGADKPIDLRITNIPNIKNVTAKRQLKFNYKGQDYKVSVKYNKNAIAFFEYYPQTNLEVYFDAPTSPDANYALLSALQPMVEGKSETEAVNLLLHFVQKSFEYKTDGDQFGREKFLFAEETLFYPFSDCEDRSILFAYLVRNLLGLEVVGLDYPGHIATAVHFTGDVKGDFVMYKGKKYIVCDPTYINANLGMRLPQVKDATPKVIFLSLSSLSGSD